MIYQVRANLFFTDPDEGRDFYHDCQLASGKACHLNPGTREQELSLAELIENHHNESPGAPCTVLSSSSPA